eukprot:jgi/Chlat1/6387/Chrsp44S00451
MGGGSKRSGGGRGRGGPSKNADGLGRTLIRHRFGRGTAAPKSQAAAHAAAAALSAAHERDWGPDPSRLASITERNDLDELFARATMEDRDFAAEKDNNVVVLAAGGQDPRGRVTDAARRAAETEHAARMRVPRRPHWDASTTPSALDKLERESFLEWRRSLAELESDARVVTVVDSRNPLLYRCPDIEAYVREIDPRKKMLVLLNKGDLLPVEMRRRWAEFLTAHRLHYIFWSAKLASEEDTAAPAGSGESEDIALVTDRDILLNKLEVMARQVAKSMGIADDKPVTAGFVGYPNVGKSSTINALVGQKKTGVTSTPGKTKHFQTLIVRPGLVLCDCPGLVFPSFTSSKAEMVTAGVLPIDRLTEHRGPVGIVAKRVPREVLEKTYSIHLPPPLEHEDPNRPPTASELLRAYCVAHGWYGNGGLPDETRSSRQLLKDYLSGKILYCHPPPSPEEENSEDFPPESNYLEPDEEWDSEDEWEEEWEEVEDPDAPGTSGLKAKQASATEKDKEDGTAISETSEVLTRANGQPVRALHKFQKKPPRRKDRSWQGASPYA